jgi:HEAT repeat protein
MLACTLPAVALLLAQVSAPHAPEGTPAGTVREVFSRRTELDRRTEKELVQELARLGADSVPALLDLVSGEGLEELLGPDQDEPVLVCSPDRIGGLALEALSLLPPGSVLECVRRREQAEPSREARLAHARVIGALHSASGLETLFAIASAFAKELCSPTVRTPLELALESILDRDPRAFHALEELLPKLEEESLALCAEALETVGRPEGASLLGKLLQRGGELELRALAALADLERRFPWRLHVDVRPQIRARLESADPKARRAAAIALGTVHDTEAFRPLIERLQDSDSEVAKAAEWALQRLSGTTAPKTPRQWNVWHQRELAWWSSEGERLRAELADPAPERSLAAVRELSQRRFGKDEIAADLGERVAGLTPELQKLTCDTLARMDSTHCVPELVELLFHEDGAVRSAAWRALQALTEERFPAEPRIWEAYAFD